MFEDSDDKIPIYINFDNLVRYHFGIFAFTGGGKSNLLSNLLRKILKNTADTKIILFDISCEYPFLLADIFADSSIKSKIILENKVNNTDQFYVSVVKPREFEDDERAKKGLDDIFEKGLVNNFVKPYSVTPKCKEVLNELNDLKNEVGGKPHYLDAINQIHNTIFQHMVSNKLTESSFIDETFVTVLSVCATEAIKTFKVNDKSGLYAWAFSRGTLVSRLKKQDKDGDSDREEGEENIAGTKPYDEGMTEDDILELLEGDARLVCISISDPYTIKDYLFR
jgi:uncharacterized protein